MTVVLHYTADLAPEVQDSAFSWNGLQAVSYVFIGEFSLWYQNWVTISAVIGSSYYVRYMLVCSGYAGYRVRQSVGQSHYSASSKRCSTPRSFMSIVLLFCDNAT